MEAAVHSLDHFALTVPDANVADAFYSNFGLRTSESGNALRLETPNGLARVLFEGARKRLHHLSFGIDASDLARFRARLESAGVALVDPPKEIERSAEALWFRDPDGNLLELRAGARRAPGEKSQMTVKLAAAGERAAPEGKARGNPRRLGHTLLFSPDVQRQIDFYKRFLGLALADRSGEIVAFLYSPHGSDHHILAFGKSERPGFHHASFELGGIDEIGVAAMHMHDRGHTEGWGFGRHYIGSNYFHYIRDPWGSFAEYFCDIDYIPAGCAWQDRNVPAEHALFMWGPSPPSYFFENVES